MPRQGDLRLIIHSAELENVDPKSHYNKLIPFNLWCKIFVICRGKVIQKYQTSIKQRDSNPKWDDSFLISLPKLGRAETLDIRMELWNSPLGYAPKGKYQKLHHTCSVSRADVKNLEGQIETHTLQTENEYKGKITYSLKYIVAAGTRQPKGFSLKKETFNSAETRSDWSGASKIVCGPILIYKGDKGLRDNSRYCVSVVLVTEGEGEKPEIEVVPQRNVSINELIKIVDSSDLANTKVVYSYDFEVERIKERYDALYTVNGIAHNFWVPAFGEPLRLCCVSGNGFSSESALENLEFSTYHVWKTIRKEHKDTNFHLMFHLGDQVYADNLWSDVEELRLRHAHPHKESLASMKWSTPLQEDMEKVFLDIYLKHFQDRHIRDVVSNIPCIMMWGDHDIFSGWGTYSKKFQDTELFHGILSVAEKFFCAFQLGCSPAHLPGCTLLPSTGKTQVYTIDNVGILSLDLKSEQTPDQFLSAKTHRYIANWLDTQPALDHLFVLSSIPFVTSSVPVGSNLLAGCGLSFGDTVPNQWATSQHKSELSRLLKILFDYASSSQTRISVLSGVIGAGALSVIKHRRYKRKSNAGVICNLTTSPVVNAPMNKMCSGLLTFRSHQKQEIDDILTGKLCQINSTKVILKRNFLEIFMQPDKAFVCKWVVEEPKKTVLSVYINPAIEGAKAEVR